MERVLAPTQQVYCPPKGKVPLLDSHTSRMHMLHPDLEPRPLCCALECPLATTSVVEYGHGWRQTGHLAVSGVRAWSAGMGFRAPTSSDTPWKHYPPQNRPWCLKG